jgi:hypothetical protein
VHVGQLVQEWVTLTPPVDVSTRRPGHSRVQSSTMLNERKRRPEPRKSISKSIDQRCMGFSAGVSGAWRDTPRGGLAGRQLTADPI